MDRKPAHLLRAGQIADQFQEFRHRFDPESGFRGAALSRLGGLKRTGVSLMRLAPGKDSFPYHAHLLEEEWMYVVQGRGQAVVDGRVQELGPGDFLAFPAPSVPHQVKNPYGEELVYLTGGENRELDVVDYPGLGRRYVLLPETGRLTFHELGPGQYPLGPADET